MKRATTSKRKEAEQRNIRKGRVIEEQSGRVETEEMSEKIKFFIRGIQKAFNKI
tara:strand:- start:376 stop:537 length:162 start_codon:yes stop_codon:yes gene_type:complete